MHVSMYISYAHASFTVLIVWRERECVCVYAIPFFGRLVGSAQVGRGIVDNLFTIYSFIVIVVIVGSVFALRAFSLWKFVRISAAAVRMPNSLWEIGELGKLTPLHTYVCTFV